MRVTNSLLARGEYKVSLVGTLYLGAAIAPATSRYNTDALSTTSNLRAAAASRRRSASRDSRISTWCATRTLGPVPVHRPRCSCTRPSGSPSKMVDAQRTQFSLATRGSRAPLRPPRIGKLSMPDVMDINGPGSDSHLQFLNWTADNNGAWDYAADTRGYTYGFGRRVRRRLLVGAVRRCADADRRQRRSNLDWNLRRARGDNYELEYRELPLPLRCPATMMFAAERKGTVRLLGLRQPCQHGLVPQRRSTKRSMTARTAAPSAVPDITAHTPGTTVKYGVGLNFEQELTPKTCARLVASAGTRGSTRATPIRRSTRPSSWVPTKMAGPGTAPTTSSASSAFQTPSSATTRTYLANGGLGFLHGRWPPALRARRHLRGLLHRRTITAVCSPRWIRPTHCPPRLQPGPRAGRCL